MNLLRIVRCEVRGPSALHLQFDNGVTKVVDLTPLLHGPVFEPLRDPRFFALATLDATCGTVVWPNGADLAPEALLALPPVALR